MRLIATDIVQREKMSGHLDQAILSKAFRGDLMPQDPNDEPASMLLERIRAEREADGTKLQRRKRRSTAAGQLEGA